MVKSETGSSILAVSAMRSENMAQNPLKVAFDGKQ